MDTAPGSTPPQGNPANTEMDAPNLSTMEGRDGAGALPLLPPVPPQEGGEGLAEEGRLANADRDKFDQQPAAAAAAAAGMLLRLRLFICDSTDGTRITGGCGFEARQTAASSTRIYWYSFSYRHNVCTQHVLLRVGLCYCLLLFLPLRMVYVLCRHVASSLLLRLVYLWT